MQCVTCGEEKELPYRHPDGGRECQNCRKKRKRKERGLRKPGPTRLDGAPEQCGKGHALTLDNTLVETRKDGRVRYRCRTCYRHHALLRMYGITPEQYYAMLEAQDHKCVTCGISFGEADRDTHVDHNHVTGAVRELLCPPCNQTIGLVKEDTARLRRIADYLDKHAALVRESST